MFLEVWSLVHPGAVVCSQALLLNTFHNVNPPSGEQPFFQGQRVSCARL